MQLKVKVIETRGAVDVQFVGWYGLTSEQKKELGFVERELVSVDAELERIAKILKVEPKKQGNTYIFEKGGIDENED